MKKIALFLFSAVMICRVYPQSNNHDLPLEFKNIAAQAFQKVSPATSQWFVNAAKLHPTGAFDTAWSKKKLAEKFTAADLKQIGELLLVMMAYQKMIDKDARNDTKMAAQDKRLASTENKIKTDNTKIEQQMKEASEKAGKTMNSAQISSSIGIASGAATIGNISTINQNTSPVYSKPQTSQKIDSTKLKVNNLNLNIQESKTGQDKKIPEDAKKPGDDDKWLMNLTIQKLLNQLEEIKRREILTKPLLNP